MSRTRCRASIGTHPHTLLITSRTVRMCRAMLRYEANLNSSPHPSGSLPTASNGPTACNDCVFLDAHLLRLFKAVLKAQHASNTGLAGA